MTFHTLAWVPDRPEAWPRAEYFAWTNENLSVG
jgi:hypothetical protein